MRRVNWRQDLGISMVEATIILATISILTAVMAPVGKRTTDTARLARARMDVQAISQAVLDFKTASPDQNKFTVDGSRDGQRVALLVSDGDIPREMSGEGSNAWRRPVGSSRVPVDFLERHLVTNDPEGRADHGYPVPQTLSGPGWRGAYLSGAVDPDPWGNRYMVNVKFMVSRDRNPPWYDVFVYSAGPDEVIDTPFAVDGAVPGNDDLMAMVFRHPLAKTSAVDGSDEAGN